MTTPTTASSSVQETSPTGAATPELSDLDRARVEFRQEILDAGLLVDAGEPGLYARSGEFEDVLDAVVATIRATMADLAPRRLRFAPVFPRSEFERTDYIASFPHLTGAIHSFTGTDRDHAKLLAARAAGDEWDSYLVPAETMLVSAVCHPLYERLAGTSIRDGGQVFDILGYSFRHEPSLDPMRLQAFRMQEFVFVGTPAEARDFRNTHSAAQLALLEALELDVTRVPANDPFFGRAGRMLARTQLDDELKLEITVPIYGDLDTEGTAIASGNSHGDHFGAPFEITTADGETAHSACIAWGLERIVLALHRTHGLDSTTWPAGVRARLGL